MASSAGTRLAIFFLALCATVAARAGQLAVSDVENSFARASLSISAEKVREKGRDYLVVHIASRGLRLGARDRGMEMHEVIEDGPGAAYLPVTVACDRIELRIGGRTLKPDRASPCLDAMRLARIVSMPVFVVFALDAAAAGEAVVQVPVVVERPDPPVQRSMHPREEPALYRPHVVESLLGERTLSASIEVR